MAIFKNLFVIASTGFLALAVATEAKAVTLTYDRSIGRPANLAEGEIPGIPGGTLAVPQGIAVQESTGNIFVANGGNNRLEVFDSEGNYLRGIGGTGSGPGQSDGQSAIAFEPNTGNLYAGDVFNNRINIFDSQGNYVDSIAEGLFGGLIPGRAFFGPSGIVFDDNGFGYVGDFSGDKILQFNAEGEIVDEFGSFGTAPGQFQGPAAIAITSSGNFVVTDQFNNRIQILTPEGEPITVFGELGSEPGQLIQPIDVEVDEQDNIYVTDSINSRVQVYDINGNFLTAFGEPALDENGEVVPPRQLGESPYGIPLDLRPGRFNWTGGSEYKDGKLYVGDFFQGRVQVLNVDNQPSATASVPEPSSTLGFLALGAMGAGAWWKRKRNI
jgi:DNA-binding beta-propeller fold protein YncE